MAGQGVGTDSVEASGNTGAYYRFDPRLRIMVLDLGVDPGSLLRRARLPEDLFSRGPIRLEQLEMYRLWRALEEEVAAEAGSAGDLPLRTAQAISVEAFDPALFAALASPDLGVAARRIAIHKKLIGPTRIEVVARPTDLTLRLSWPSGIEPPASLVLTELLFWVALARLATRHRIEPLRITCPNPPADQTGYRAYTGITILERPTPSITFSAGDSARPFLMANDAMWDAFEPALRKRLAEIDDGDTHAERVRTALLQLLPSGQSSMAAVGSRLAMSTRTLQRRLSAEGTMFQDVLNETRESLARHYLTNTAMSIEEIAFLIGYDEPSSFYRAFHTWTGRTPAQVRSVSLSATRR